jgi:DNA-binding GntR family transcriptional regulator
MAMVGSITGQVYERLRDDLAHCVLPPGQRLRTNLLSGRFGVSLSVVREALTRLAAEGLVVADPRRGFSAASISTADLRSLTEAATGLASLCLPASIRAGDASWEQALAQSWDVVQRTTLIEQGQLSEAFAVAHAGFETALMSACPNPWLLRLRDTLAVQTQRYHRICVALAAVEPDPRPLLHDILNAALARDADGAVMLIERSFKANLGRFLDVLERHPDLIPS